MRGTPQRGRGSTLKGLGKGIGRGNTIAKITDEEGFIFPSIQEAMTTQKNKGYAFSSGGTKTSKEVLKTEVQFFIKTNCESVLILDSKDEQWIPDPWEIKNRHLSTTQYPSTDGRPRYLYERISISSSSLLVIEEKFAIILYLICGSWI